MKTLTADVIIPAANPAGICAAIAASRLGANVLLLEPDPVVGGLNTSGLNNNEQHHMHPSETFDGLCREHFRRLASFYPESWGSRPGWFHSRDALRVWEDMLGECQGITLLTGRVATGVEMQGNRIRALLLEDGARVEGKVFLDTTYEGDLLAWTGARHRLGREAKSAREPSAGVCWNDPLIPINPYDDEGLLPGICPGPVPVEGEASPLVQNMNFRLTLTDDPENRVEIPEVAPGNPREFELLGRAFDAGNITELKQVLGLYPLPGRKFEGNNNQKAILSLSPRGFSIPWIHASPAERRSMLADTREMNLRLLWFLRTDPRVPAEVRKQMERLGLPADEYKENKHWPFEIYAREGRRLEGETLLTEADLAGGERHPDTIALASHYLDSHWVERYPVGRDGFRNEGRLWRPGNIHPLPYRIMLPKESDCENLLVPVAVSATHVAFCTIHLEPTWMALGEAAGTAAALCLETGASLHTLGISRLQEALRKHGAGLSVLE